MSIARYVLRSDAVIVGPRGIEVVVGLPWYRSLPWASLAGVGLSVDSREVELDRATIDGREIGELTSRDDYWFLQHRARVRIPDARIGEPGDSCVIELRMRLRIPGPLLADGSPMPYEFITRRDVILIAA